jgi:hypothetical protein
MWEVFMEGSVTAGECIVTSVKKGAINVSEHEGRWKVSAD